MNSRVLFLKDETLRLMIVRDISSPAPGDETRRLLSRSKELLLARRQKTSVLEMTETDATEHEDLLLQLPQQMPETQKSDYIGNAFLSFGTNRNISVTSIK